MPEVRLLPFLKNANQPNRTDVILYFSQRLTRILHSERAFFLWHVAGIVFLLHSCSPEVKNVALPLETPQSFSESGDTIPSDRWWEDFNDPRLNFWVDTAMGNNFNILSAWEQLRAAEAVIDRESASLIPNIDASGRSAITRPEPDFVGGENTRLGLNASYEIDLWGRIRSRVEAEEYRARATLADYQATSISLVAEISRTWMLIQGARERLKIIDAQVVNNEQILNLLRSRFGTGQIRAVDILRQQQLIKATEEEKYITQSQERVLNNQFAVLIGKIPGQFVDTTIIGLPSLTPLPETGIPLELVRRRPDIRAANFRLIAADRDLAVAVTNKYPRITLSGQAQARSNDIDDLFENWAYTLAGNILAPLFYGGQLSAEVDRNEALKRQALFSYGQTVLNAFREVEDALIQEQKQKERIEVINRQIELADQSYKQLRLGYFNGLSNYLDVLNALDSQQQLERDLIQARSDLILIRIDLYRALAGGFETKREKDSKDMMTIEKEERQ